MPSLTTGQIVEALVTNEPERLLGSTESEQVDFKLAPYVLTENHQKWELAKDVAAFANKRRGLNSHQRLREAGFAPWQNADIELEEGGLIARRNDIVTWVEPDRLGYARASGL
jgi:hypothetical protein